MNTKQVEVKTGISRQNIRFYEKMGLLHPVRKEENAYRDYSQEDVDRLEYIKLFRMLSIPIEDISKIFCKEISLEEVLRTQKESLTDKQKELQGALRICEQMEKECVAGKDISAIEYLGRMEYEQHAKGGFGGFREDYKKLVASEGIRQYSFVTDEEILTSESLKAVIHDSLGEDWDVKKEKEGILVQHQNLTYQISKKKLTSDRKKRQMSTLVILTLEDSKEIAMPENRRQFLYTLHSVGQNIKAHKWRSVLSVLFSLFMILLLAAYTGSLRNVQKQQDILPKRTLIEGRIYNQNGTLDDGILIQDNYLEAIASSPYIANYMEKANLSAMLGHDSEKPCTISGMNEALLNEKMEKVKVEWNDLYNVKSFEQSFDTCMVNQDFAKNQGLKIGDAIDLDTYYYWLDPEQQALIQLPLLSANLEIVGTYQMTNESSDEALSDIIMPLNGVKKWYENEQKRYYANAVSFCVKNPKELNALKKELMDIGFNEIQTELETDYAGNAVSLNDQKFIETADRLRHSQNMLQSFLLLILVLIILIGVIVAYLITQSRRSEVIIMRMLGVKRKSIAGSYMMEQMSLFSCGFLGAVLLVLLPGVPVSSLFVQMILLFMGSYAVGVFVAIGQMIPNKSVQMGHDS
ncbi:MAG: MerR family transcriptional regulator [Hespellia sp.]|nr:MerR family transcriptional regulator [Hespellia sp.]